MVESIGRKLPVRMLAEVDISTHISLIILKIISNRRLVWKTHDGKEHSREGYQLPVLATWRQPTFYKCHDYLITLDFPWVYEDRVKLTEDKNKERASVLIFLL